MGTQHLDYEVAQFAVYRIAKNLAQAGAPIPVSQVRAFLLGGGPWYNESAEMLGSLGYDSGACGYAANREFWIKIGVSEALHQIFCNAS